MRETPRRKDLDLEKYPAALAAATGTGNPHHHGLRAQIVTIS